MEAKSTDKTTFRITEGRELLGELIYENLFFLKAEIKLPNADLYDVKPVGFFGTRIAITKNGTEIARLEMNWRGQIVLAFQDGEEFVVKAKGTFHSKYVIENKDEERLIQLDPKFDWSKFNYNYEITYDKKPQDILLVLLGVYASNYFIACMSGAMSGM